MTITRLRSSAPRALILTLSAFAMGAVCAQTAVKPGFNLFSTDQDVEIGRQSAIEAERQLPLLRKPAVESYVGAIGKRLAAVLPGARFPYRFKVVNASEINAFALPGGYMYVNRGLIEAAANEGQLAGVLAHEMSHVALRHGTHQASKAYLGQAGLGVLGGLLGKKEGSTGRVIGAVGGFGLNALFLKFSRTDEEQADILGAQTMAKAGYDPKDMVDFFEVLRAKQNHDPGKVEQFFSSHPAPQDRAARIRAETAMLTVRPAAPVGGFGQTRAALLAMPAARPTPQLTQNLAPAPPPRANPARSGDTAIPAPAATFRTFEPRNHLFRIEHPSNWQADESTDGLGVTLAPRGGFVDAGGPEKELIHGVVARHYEPFQSEADTDGRFSFLGSPGAPRAQSSRTGLAEATNDLVGEILRNNPALERVADSPRSDTIDGGSALSLVLAGRSGVTGEEERVTVFTRALPDDHIVYALFIAPAQDYRALKETFARMMDSLRVNEGASHP